LIEQYYSALARYYGGTERFPRESFDAILNQVREVSWKVPGFASRLWETSDLGRPIRIESVLKSQGRDLQSSYFDEAMQRWRASLRSQIQPSFQALEIEDQQKKVKDYFHRMRRQSDRFQNITDAELRKKLAPEIKAFREQMQSDPEFQSIRAWLIEQRLSSELFQDTLRTRDPDLILSELDSLHVQAREFFTNQGVDDVPDLAISALRSQVPKVDTWLADHNSFPMDMPPQIP
jgi:hypothetical protein